VRKLILDEQPTNPKYYEKMSELLDALIRERKAQALDYADYLQHIQALAKRVAKPETGDSYPPSLDTPAKRALYDNLSQDEALALAVDAEVKAARMDDWRGHAIKQRVVRNAIRRALNGDGARADMIFEIVVQQHEY
jgi:type I restriction enzyme R subunit